MNELLSDVGTNLTWRGRRIDLKFTTEGTAHVPAWYGVDSASREPVPDAELPRISDEDGLWGDDVVQLLTVRGSHYVLHHRGPLYPVEAASLEQPGAACRFEVKTIETVGPGAYSPKLCADVQASRVEVPRMPERIWNIDP